VVVEADPSCMAVVPLLLTLGWFSSWWSRFVGHDEAALVIARPWWRVLVAGEVGGARWSVRGRGSVGDGINPCQMVDTDAVTFTGAAMPSCGASRSPTPQPSCISGETLGSFGQQHRYRRILSLRCCFGMQRFRGLGSWW
jgi:hypothetical protein